MSIASENTPIDLSQAAILRPRLITNQFHVALAKPTTAPCGIPRCHTALFFLVSQPPLHDALNISD
jgi:hypothetical protein